MKKIMLLSLFLCCITTMSAQGYDYAIDSRHNDSILIFNVKGYHRYRIFYSVISQPVTYRNPTIGLEYQFFYINGRFHIYDKNTYRYIYEIEKQYPTFEIIYVKQEEDNDSLVNKTISNYIEQRIEEDFAGVTFPEVMEQETSVPLYLVPRQTPKCKKLCPYGIERYENTDIRR